MRKIRTACVIDAPPEAVWPLLCSSKMDTRIPCAFRLGIPKPVECRLPEGEGGVGRERQCVSNRGIIHQRITCWDAPRCLRFQMEDTNLYFRPCVTSIEEAFELEALDGERTRVVRTTTLAVVGMGRFLKSAIMLAGLKCVHRYVFRNWRRLAVT
ncbi:MAG: SRPBCC family protein [Luteolibacter sp.]